MKKYTEKQAYLELHFSVLLWGFTAILGRLIQLDATLLVWYRILITVLSFLVIKNSIQAAIKVPKTLLFRLFSVGMIIALHWVTFYGAIHIANVSVAVGCLATTSLFTSILEPILLPRKLKLEEVIMGCIVTLGLGLMFFYGQNYKIGIIVGLSSAFFAALFTTMNKKIIDTKTVDPKVMTLIEMLGGLLFLTLVLPFYLHWKKDIGYFPSSSDWVYLLILALVCTTLPFILSLRALSKLSAFSTVLAVNMEPIYAIVLAVLLFKENEEINTRFYLGTAIVVLAVFTYPMLEKRLSTLKK